MKIKTTNVLGLDYGDKTIGVAISDKLGITAQALEVIRRSDEKTFKPSLKRLSDIIKKYNVETIVLGYPKNMDNSQGFRCQKTLYFRDRLARNFKNILIVLWDERLSTVAADRNLRTLSKAQRDQIIDKMAAQFILQGYLDSKATENKEVSPSE